ncbi:TonB-dependent receptor plug domain-containing protein [Desertivirga arenae]|uniref:TonB-dependent receptor plug domain-containing protein n=1 Tax=Desertivirga arenae TaxID=2810309 RepID=UPI001A960761|nr:TonB-dependent receptor plug domain-containing protein [Pedobacter sp. SYSU D00823]
MKTLSLFIFFISMIAAALNAKAQNVSQYQKEKIYIHTNHVFFKQGEVLFYKLYLVDGKDQKPVAPSKIAYVEIVGPSGTVVEKQSYKIENGYAEGAFAIQENAVGGVYKLKAYTSWMRNENDSKFFSKEFNVQKVISPRLLMKLDFPEKGYGPGSRVKADFSARTLADKPLANLNGHFKVSIGGKTGEAQALKTDATGKASISFDLPKDLATTDGLLTVTLSHDAFVESISRSIPITLDKIDLQFMPEGGTFVAGVKSRLAFKAINEFGKPVDVKGIIEDGEGNTVAHFESYKFGMGKVEIAPKSGMVYKALILSASGNKTRYPLPKVMDEGVALQLNRQEGKVVVSINSTSTTKIVLTGKSKEINYYTKQLNLKEGRNELEVNENIFPVGITQFTLFSSTGIPLAERIVFLNKHKKLTVSIATDKTRYKPREKVELMITSKDQSGKPVPSNFSLAVVDDKLWSYADDKQDHIFSWLLLSSELEGKIEEPQFYFKKNEPKAAEALDLLTLTQGYRYFDFIEPVKQTKQLRFGLGENISVLGIITAEDGKPVQGTVYLIENITNGKVLQLKTKNDGIFYFPSLDKPGNYLILAQGGDKKQKIKIRLLQSGLNYSFAQAQLKIISDAFAEQTDVLKKEPAEANAPKKEAFDILLGAGNNALNEVVVVGYGAMLKQNVTGSVVTVRREDLSVGDFGLGNLLQGKIPGLVVTEVANPGAAPVVRIRGANTLAANGEPLIIVDGIPVGNSGLNQLDPNDIQSITVLKDAGATAIYGSRGANGVILITSKRNIAGKLKIKVTDKASFESEYVNVTGPQFTIAKKFYVPAYKSTETEERTDFRETIYWNPVVQTNREGVAKLEFYNSDATTTFRAITEGIGYNGLLGRADTTYTTTNTLNLDVKIPPYLTVGDKALLPLVIKNNGQKKLDATIAVQVPEGIKVGDYKSTISIARDSSLQILLPIEAIRNTSGEIKFGVAGPGEKETLSFPIAVQAKGFPVIETFSGNKSARHEFTVSKMINGTSTPKLMLYKDVEGQLVNGIESMLREPYGCFEQTSSTTYPNVFILKYLKQVGKANREIETKALGYLKNGYKRLVGYETSENGFEWFGKAPAHEALTAYGLLEFTAMKEFLEVDEAMLKRTKNFLLARRDGKGGFRLASGGYDRFASVPNAIANIYIVYAMTTAGFGKDIEPEYQAALTQAFNSEDAYKLALMALSADNLKKVSDYNELMQALKISYTKRKLSSETSVVNSRDASLRVETLSLYALALMRQKNPDIALVAELISKVLNEKSYYGYGSTQATVMALEAVVEYAKLSQKQLVNNDVNFVLNGHQVKENDELAKYILEGKNSFEVSYKDGQEGIPYNLEVAYQTYTPPTSSKASISISTSLNKSSASIGETVRMTAVITNKESNLQAMTTTKIGIPAGLSTQPWQLKELMEKGQVAYYEIFDNYLVLYWMGFAAKEAKTINLDLKAEVPGRYKGKASNVYLYYTPEYKYWNDGAEVELK